MTLPLQDHEMLLSKDFNNTGRIDEKEEEEKDENDDDVASLTSTNTSSSSSSQPLPLPSLSLLAAKNEVTITTTRIGTYQFSDPDPDDPFADEFDCGGGTIVPCSVKLNGNLFTQTIQQQQGNDKFEFCKDKVQKFRFEDFQGLAEFMTLHKQGIEDKDMTTLKQVHERFQIVIQTILVQYNLYASVLKGMHIGKVAPYATPNVRIGRGQYASFLHSDSTYAPPRNSNNSTTTSSSCSTPQAMINIWICLNDNPPNNQLAFLLDCPRKYTTLYHGKLIGQREYIEGQILHYDKSMCWGSFYCFIAGESNTARNVLLHGAVDIPTTTTTTTSIGNRQVEHRKSVEFRYLI